MNRRFSMLPVAVCSLSLALLAACGGDDDDAPALDAGTADTGVDASLDAARPDAGSCPDVDGDGAGAMPCGDDCDDNDASRFPGNTEVCDGDDEDCNDATFGPDGDGDTYVSTLCCNGPDNCGNDCNDTLNTVNPGAAEQCNGGVDDDCNGLADAADGVCVPCAPGSRGFDGDCVEIFECVEFAPCGAAAGTTCEDTPSSYVCNCPPGYAAPAAAGTCTDVNECATDVCGAGSATCTNLVGSYACECLAGYTAASTGAPCVDVDECATGTPCGAGRGTCANIGGSYACTCNAGYAAPATGGTCARFSDLGDGTVRDNGSRLVWQQGFSSGGQSQAASILYCTTLALDGGGWRLPTREELFAIVDLSVGVPTIDTSFFPGTPAELFWSSSTVVGLPTSGWYVSFSLGSATIAGVNNLYRARCVR